jgi:hypothetical protein
MLRGLVTRWEKKIDTISTNFMPAIIEIEFNSKDMRKVCIIINLHGPYSDINTF